MWKVQTEGYQEGRGFPAGTVTFPYFGTTPDCEFIASGENKKRPDAVSIGRQGNFLHWGFSASPDYLTEEAQLVFVNAIHYIHQFDGQAPVARKIQNLVIRPHLDDLMWVISDDGFAALQSAFQGHARVKPDRSSLLKRFVSEDICERFKDDWPAYIAYYQENRPYLFPAKGGDGWQKLIVDEDAKSLGIANTDPAILEKCISLWQSGKQAELAERTLRRYSNESFATAAEWRDWFEKNRNHLFLSEDSGFKFLVFAHHKRSQPNLDNEADGPDPHSPVRFRAEIEPLDGSQVKVVVSATLADGWHIYASTPDDSAYSPTTIDFGIGDGVVAVGKLKCPQASPHPLEKNTTVYEKAVEFEQVIKVDSQKLNFLSIQVSYQACDESRCLQPTLTTLKVELPKQP